MATQSFGAPIPGSSLFTHPPGDRPWERPPELDTVDDALSYYFTNLNNDEVIDDLMAVIDMGVPINPIVKSLYLSSVMNGRHNLDVGLLVAPVLTEFLAAVAKSYNIDYKFSETDPEEQKQEKEDEKIRMMLEAAIDEGIELTGEDDQGVALLKEMAEALDEQQEPEEDMEDIPDEPPAQEELQLEQAPPEEAPPTLEPEEGMGLMSRRDM